MSRLRHITGKFGRRRRLRRGVLLSILLLLVCFLGLIFYVSRPKRLAGLASMLLTEMTGANVTIQSARIGIDGSIRLRDVELRVPGDNVDADRLFTAGRVHIRQDVLSLLGGRFKPTSMVLYQPTLYVTEDPVAGTFNYQRLRKIEKPPSEKKIKELPDVVVREGVLAFGEVEAGHYLELGRIQASGNLVGQTGSTNIYSFVLRQEQTTDQLAAGNGTQAQPVLSGKLDLEKRTVSGELRGFAFEGSQRNVLPRRFREWWDRLEPTGDWPTVSFGFDPDPTIGLHAILEVKNASIQIPKEYLDARMTEVSGKFTIAKNTINVSQLRGNIAGLNYIVNGKIEGFDKSSPFNLNVKVDAFDVPADPDFWRKRSAKIAKIFDRFPGTGKISGYLNLERDTADGELKKDGLIQIRNAKGYYSKFRYMLQNVSGDIRLHNDRIEVVNVSGVGLHGGQIMITGQIAPVAENAAVDLTVTAVGLPVDDLLREALNDKQRTALDMFLDAQHYQRLRTIGILQSTKDKESRRDELDSLRAQKRDLEGKVGTSDQVSLVTKKIEELKTVLEQPVFDLAGKINLTVQITRPLGRGKKFRSKIIAETDEFNILFKYWPYPLRLVGGKLTINMPEVIAEKIEAQGLTGGKGQLDGTVQFEGGVNPKLTVSGSALPVDEVLLASIPQPQDRWVRDFHLNGAIDANGSVFKEADGQIDFNMGLQITGGTARPFNGRYQIDDLKARIALERRKATIESLTGKHNQSNLSLAGVAEWLEGAANVAVNVKLDDVRLSDPVLDLIPPEEAASRRLRALFDTYKPDGTLDAELDYKTNGRKESEFSLMMKPESLAFDLRGQRVQLTDITGEATAYRNGVRLKDWSATFDKGRFKASGEMNFGEKPEVDLSFDATNKSFGPAIRSVIPPSVTKVIDALKLNGGYEIKDAHLIYRPAATDKDVVDFKGKLKLIDATATVGVAITDLQGELDIAATLAPNAQWPRLDIKLDASRLKAVDRQIAPLMLHLVSTRDPAVIEIKELKGELYGGAIWGTGSVDMSRGGHYSLSMSMHDALLDGVVHPQNHPLDKPDTTTQPDGERVPTGKIAASLTIEGTPGNPTDRRGRGNIDIRDAKLYELPMALGMLQLLNFSLPTSRSFDRASVSYLIYGDTVRFDAIAIEAPSIRIVGTGEMEYESLKLNLNLASRNPRALNDPLTSIMSGIKDELVSIHVGGTLTKPKTQVQSFTKVKGTWKEIFGGKSSSKSFDSSMTTTSAER